MSKELEEIKKVYHTVNQWVLTEQPYNTVETRCELINRLIIPLEEHLHACRIICDEENNPPSIIDQNRAVARVEWRVSDRFDKTVRYVNLTFGDVEALWEI